MSARTVLLLLLATALVTTVTGGLVGWGLSSATLTRASAVATGTPGPAGATGAAGAKGDSGATGASGAGGGTGAAGSTGPAGKAGAGGTQGVPGPAGPIGPAGPAGSNASIATSTFQSAAGTVLAMPNPTTGPVTTSIVPAGPTLIGFSLSLTGLFGQTTCGLYDTSGTQIAAAPPVTVGSAPVLVAMTQVVTLTAPSVLELRCANVFPDFENYTNLSIYALSFATS